MTIRLSRVLLYSHDTYGLGHLRRNLVLARQLLMSPAPPQVVLATGSPVIDRVPLPPGLACVSLPPVIKKGADRYDSLDPSLDISLVRRARSAVLSDVVARWRPDVLLVDHAPHGMKGELLPVFDTLRRRSPRTKVVLGLRDILDDPERVVAAWRGDGVVETLERVYDAVLVYGERSVFDLARLYRLPPSVAAGLEYCGYVAGPPSAGPIAPPGLGPGTEYVLGTVGGGGDGVDLLVATAKAAAAAGLAAVLCTGPLMPDADRAHLGEAVGGPPGVVVVEHLADLAGVAAGARCVVSRGGYNSLCELVGLGVPAVVVPRSTPRVEQVLRAEAFAHRGLVRVVEERDDLAGSLAQAVMDATAGAMRPHEQLCLDGAARAVDAVRRLVEGAPVTGAGLPDETFEVPA